MKEKEIIGYKLIKPEYKKAVFSILGVDMFMPIVEGCDLSVDWSINTCRAAGVLDLWFEPVYKEPEFEFGRWYKGTRAKAFVFVESKEKRYGFLGNGEWLIEDCTTEKFDYTYLTPATDEEVKERLLAYAKEHYPAGTKVKGARFPDSDFVYTIDLLQYKDDYMICNRNMSYVFYEGKWAEIIKEEPIKINGYEAKFEDKHVSFGCQKVSVKFIKKVHELITKHNVDFNADKEQIKKIVEHYK